MSKFWSLKPHLVSKVWGGEKLKAMKGIENMDEPLGESWEVSRLEDGPSTISFEGIEKPLCRHFTQDDLPYLVKFIDTTDNLSVQVHPGNEFARLYENSMGKTECWLILNSGEGAGIYLGLKEGIEKEQLQEAINSGEDLSPFLNFYPVKRGDFFFVPSGSIHAIGKGVTLAEIQQSSGVTYRVWDWNRVGLDGKARELHVDKAMKVIEFDSKKNSKEYFKANNGLLENEGKAEVVSHTDFIVDLYNFSERIELNLVESGRVSCLVNISEGEIAIDGQVISAYESVVFEKGSKDRISVRCADSSGEDRCLSLLHVY